MISSIVLHQRAVRVCVCVNSVLQETDMNEDSQTGLAEDERSQPADGDKGRRAGRASRRETTVPPNTGPGK